MSARREQTAEALCTAVADAVRHSAQALVSMQSPDGAWRGQRTGDPSLESDYILLQHWLYSPEGRNWNPAARRVMNKAVRSIVRRQLPQGGFSTHPEGPADLNVTIKAYAALRLAGLDATDPRLSRARETILGLGGLEAADGLVKLRLSFFGLYPRQYCPAIPPEMLLLPRNPVNRLAAWTQSVLVPMSIVYALNPRRAVPAGFDLNELLSGSSFRQSGGSSFSDRLAKLWDRRGMNGIRRKAIRRAEHQMLECLKESDGVIYPALVHVMMALDALGYAPEHPDRKEAQEQLDAFVSESDEEITIQPCRSAVADTAIAAAALSESAHGGDLRRSGEWLLSQNWIGADNMSTVLLALPLAKADHDGVQKAAVSCALGRLLSTQSTDGGWAAFDVNRGQTPPRYLGFGASEAIVDATCPAITGRALAALCAHGVSAGHPAVRRAIDYLLRTQEQDGSWSGSCGVGYIYGTCYALRGLRAGGVSDREAAVLRAGEWLRSIQNADGGWGESCASHSEWCFVAAESTPTQTGWAIMGLLAGGDTVSLSVNHGAEYLVNAQRPDGIWSERLATACGVPRGLYLTHDLYRIGFPLLALSNFLKTRREAPPG